MTQRASITILSGLALIIIGVAALTLLPFAAGHKNDLGYFSMCPFAPWSTLSLLVVAGIVWAIRQYLATRAE